MFRQKDGMIRHIGRIIPPHIGWVYFSYLWDDFQYRWDVFSYKWDDFSYKWDDFP